MGASLDSLFVQPRLVLTARKIDLYDAINLVVYAKFPLISARRGKDLVAGFIRRDQARVAIAFLSERTEDELLDKYGREIASFRYPVGPAQYEPLLEKMVEADERWLPYFFHEHHQLTDRRHRSAMFADLHRELAGLVSTKEIALQISESERTYLMAGDAWMTADTLRAFLERHGVSLWWQNERNLESHARLERLLLSDGLAVSRHELSNGYDENQLPSYLFGEMLLKRTPTPSGYGQTRAPQNNPSTATSRKSESEPSVPDNRPRKRADANVAPRLPGNAPSPDSQNALSPVGSEQAQSLGVPSGSSRAQKEETQNHSLDQGNLTYSPGDRMLTRLQVAKRLGRDSANTTNNFVKRFPDFPKKHRAADRYSERELEAWIKLHESEL